MVGSDIKPVSFPHKVWRRPILKLFLVTQTPMKQTFDVEGTSLQFTENFLYHTFYLGLGK